MNPIENVILEEVFSRVSNATVANGYDYTITNIKKAKATPFKPHDMPGVNVWSDGKDVDGNTYGADVNTMNIIVEGYNNVAPQDGDFVTNAYILGCNLTTAIYRSTGSPLVSDNISPSLGGLITRLKPTSVTPLIGEGQSPWYGVILTFSAMFSNPIGDGQTLIT